MKKKKSKIIIGSSIVMIALLIVSAFIFKGRHMVRIPIQENTLHVSGMRSSFDLESFLVGADKPVNTCIFKGIVRDLQQYHVAWTNDLGEACEEVHGFLVVEINQVYDGDFLRAGDTVRVLCMDYLNGDEKNSVKAQKDAEYIFVNSWMLDDRYFDYCAKISPSGSWDLDPAYKSADILMGPFWNSLFPVENGVVIFYHEYFDTMKPAQEKLVRTDTMLSEKISAASVKQGGYAAMNLSDFDEMFSSLISSVKK